MLWQFYKQTKFAAWELFSYSNLIHAFSGGLGSAFSISVFYPLETARTRLQVNQVKRNPYSYEIIYRIYQREGISGLYHGLSSLVVSLFISNFVYFFIFHGLKAFLLDNGCEQHAGADLVFGIIAGCAAVLVTNPLWVVNTRLKLQNHNDDNIKYPKYSGFWDCLLTILSKEHIGSLWHGVHYSLMLVSNPALQFMAYEMLKRNLQTLLHREYLGEMCYFACGAVAKILATVSTYPLQVVQTRHRAGFHQTSKKDNQTKFRSIFQYEGIAGLFRGLEAKLLQTVLTAALMFTVYERISSYIFYMFAMQR